MGIFRIRSLENFGLIDSRELVKSNYSKHVTLEEIALHPEEDSDDKLANSKETTWPENKATTA